MLNRSLAKITLTFVGVSCTRRCNFIHYQRDEKVRNKSGLHKH